MISSPPATRSILYLDCRHLTVCILGAEKTAVGVFCPDEGLARARARCSGLLPASLAPALHTQEHRRAASYCTAVPPV